MNLRQTAVAVIAPAILALALTGAAHADTPAPAWVAAPDGRLVVYEAASANGIVLRLLDVASGKSKTLIQLPGENRWPVWSPDGHFIAFSALFNGRHFVTVTDLTGHSWLVQEIHGGPTRITWSPNSVWLVFASQTGAGDSDLFMATAGGTDIRNLTHSPTISERNPVWLGQGKRVAFAYGPAGAVQIGVLEVSDTAAPARRVLP